MITYSTYTANFLPSIITDMKKRLAFQEVANFGVRGSPYNSLA